MNLLTAEQLETVERRLLELLGRLPVAGGLDWLTEAIRQFVVAGGKRVRPQLCIWTLQQASGRPAPDAAFDVACAWELFHAFLLIHDDVIDRADTRRGLPTLHKMLETHAAGHGRSGEDLAIVAGDLLFSLAFGILVEAPLPHPMHQQQLRLFWKTACMTGLGQAMDITQSHAPLESVRTRTVMRAYHWKTAAYTFEGPMLAGAMLAGLDAAAHDAVSQFGVALGQAYQLHNDLLDLSVPAHEGCDILQGKRTIALLRASRLMPPARRKMLQRRLERLPSSNGHGLEIAETIRKSLLKCGAQQAGRKSVHRSLAAARKAACCDGLPDRLRQGMVAMLDGLQTSYFSQV